MYSLYDNKCREAAPTYLSNWKLLAQVALANTAQTTENNPLMRGQLTPQCAHVGMLASMPGTHI
jgi:hypothetical protein